MCRFSIANNRDYKKKDGEEVKNPNFFNCTAWGKTGEVIANYLKKGDPIHISGEIKQNEYTDKEGVTRYSVELGVDDFDFMGQAKNSNSESQDATYE